MGQTLEDEGWRLENEVRFVGREYKWAEHRQDCFFPEATHSASRVTDFLA